MEKTWSHRCEDKALIIQAWGCVFVCMSECALVSVCQCVCVCTTPLVVRATVCACGLLCGSVYKRGGMLIGGVGGVGG